MKKEEMKKSGCHLVARLFFCTFANKLKTIIYNGRRNKGRNDGAEH